VGRQQSLATRPKRPSTKDGAARSAGRTPNLIGQLASAANFFRSEDRAVASRSVQEELTRHERFLHRQWPDARASGTGEEHFDNALQAREWRLRWLVRLEVLDRLASIAWKVTISIAAGSAVLHYWLS
jgi:hypothetical protein